MAWDRSAAGFTEDANVVDIRLISLYVCHRNELLTFGFQGELNRLQSMTIFDSVVYLLMFPQTGGMGIEMQMGHGTTGNLHSTGVHSCHLKNGLQIFPLATWHFRIVLVGNGF